MTGTNSEQAQGLTLTAEMDALGVSGYGVMHEAEALGDVSSVELIVFRDAIARRVREQTTEDDVEPYEPSSGLDEVIQQRLSAANTIGSTVADILLSENAAKNQGAQV